MRTSKKALALVLALVLALAFAGCSAAQDNTASYSASYSTGQTSHETVNSAAQDMSNGVMIPAENTAENGEKIIKTVTVEMETLEFDAMLENLQQEIESFGGFVQTSSQSGSSINAGRYNSRSANFCVRIPSGKLNEFLQALSGIGNVLYTEQTADDVTAQYTDYELRLNTLRTQYDRLNELLSQAEDLEQVLQIEDKLADVQYEMDSITGTLNSIDDKVDLSTINISVREVRQYQEVQQQGFWDKLVSTVKDSLSQFGTAMQNVFLGLVWALPYLVIIAAVVVIILLIKRRRKRKKQAPQTPLPPAASGSDKGGTP